MERVLYSCIGTTDPVRGMRDGGLLHILRFYRPETVYLFLSGEMVRLDRQDGRIGKTFDFLRETWGGYAPRVVRYETELEDPSDMDALAEPMSTLLQRILSDFPKAEILLNLSSGTPQMQILLAQMALDTRFRARGIQVKNPEGKSGTAERTNSKRYPVEEALGLNEDEEPGAVNRCCEPKMLAVRREAIRHQLSGLIAQRNYGAIAEMGSQLPAPIPQLARHLNYRSHFLLREAREAAKGLTGYKLLADKGSLPYPIYEMVEYFGVLKHLVYLKRYSDFVLRLNPFLIRLQLEMLKNRLRLRGLTPEDLLITAAGHTRISPERVAQALPELLSALEARFGGELQERDVSIPALNVMLCRLGAEERELLLLEDCERLNGQLRNMVAHDLFSVTDEKILAICGRDTQSIVRELEKLLLEELSAYDPSELRQRLSIYERCDKRIRECL